MPRGEENRLTVIVNHEAVFIINASAIAGTLPATFIEVKKSISSHGAHEVDRKICVGSQTVV